MIKVIIFDLDGVLVDTKLIHFEALNLALKKYNFDEMKITLKILKRKIKKITR